MRSGDLVLPAPALLKNIEDSPNDLSSFLGCALGERLQPLLGEEWASRLRISALRDLLRQSVEELVAGGESSNWLYVVAVLRDISPPVELREAIRELVVGTRFSRLFSNSPLVAKMALQVACLQLRHIGDKGVEEHLIAEVVEVARQGAKGLLGQEPPDLMEVLIDATWNISMALRNGSEALEQFSGLIVRILEAWPEMARVISPLVRRLFYDLPVSLSQKLGPLFVRLRAE